MDGRSAIVAEIPRLRRYARALTGRRDIADDLVQDTLERALEKWRFWQRGRDLRPWLFAIMHNLHVDQLRKAVLATDDLKEEHFESPTRATQTDRLEIRDLDEALARLPQEQRAVLLLVAVEEMSYKDVAKTLGLPIGTVMSRLSRGRERLRLILEERQPPQNLSVVRR